MSLIFKALQRFQQPAIGQEKTSAERSAQRKGYSFRAILLSPPLALSAAVAIFALGFVVFQLTHSMSNNGHALPSTAEAAQSEGPKLSPAESVNTVALTDVPEPDLSPLPPVASKQEVTYQVHIPKAVAAPVIGEKISAASPSEKGGPEAGSQLAVPIDNSASLRSAGAELSVKSPAGIAGPQPAMPAIQAVLGRKAVFSPPAGPAALVPPVALTPSSSANAPPVQKTTPYPDYSNPIRDQQRQASRATQHLQIARLVEDIHSAIQTDNVKRTSRLLNKLVLIKGPKHPFVSKLRAFSLIRQNHLTEAKSLLDEVLSLNAEDLEAGLNMAVIDIKTGRYREARHRLEGLQQQYPEEEHVAVYLRRLPR